MSITKSEVLISANYAGQRYRNSRTEEDRAAIICTWVQNLHARGVMLEDISMAGIEFSARVDPELGLVAERIQYDIDAECAALLYG